MENFFLGVPNKNFENSVFKDIKFLLSLSNLQLLRSFHRLLYSCGADVSLKREFRSVEQPLKCKQFDVIISDWNDGAIRSSIIEFKRMHPKGLFYVFLENPDYEQIRQAYKSGADDVLSPPINLEDFFSDIINAVSANFQLPKILDDDLEKIRRYMVFHPDSLKEVLRFIPKISRTDHNVLITGETGTGKELIAKAIHAIGNRSDKPFITVNCGAIPETLIENELFGHEKGAFTGANSIRKGKFEMADQGTLFLDEIGDMSLLNQTKLLRSLEEGQIYRVGSEKPIKIDVRVISATQVNLDKAVQSKLFREDLFYRLNILNIHMPPLRNRKKDIPLLVNHYLNTTFKEMDLQEPFPVFSTQAMNILESYSWQGNIRELRNVVTRTAILLDQDKTTITPTDIPYEFARGMDQQVVVVPPEFTSNVDDGSFPMKPECYYPKIIDDPNNELIELSQRRSPIDANGIPTMLISAGESMEEIKLKAIKMTLDYTKGSQKAAAEILHIHPRTISRKLHE